MSEPKIRLSQISPSVSGTDSISGNVTITNDLTVGGNLTVSGDTTTLNVQTLLVEDNEIILNSSVTGTPSLNASVTVNRGSSSDVFLLWNESTDKWGWSDDGNTVIEFSNTVLKTGDTMTGELNVANNLLVTGNVGIGTSADKKLDFDGGELRVGQQTSGSGAWLNVNLRDGTSALAAIRISERSSASSSEAIPVTQPHLLLTRGSDTLGTFIQFKNQRDGYAGIGSLATAANTHDIRLYTGSGTEKLRVDANGNVGIGTTSPESKFHVRNDSSTAYSSTNTLTSGQTARIANESTSSNIAATLLFVATGGGGGNGVGTISGINTGTGSLALTFGTRNSGSDIIERLRITSNGEVGIGTTTPQGKLSIVTSAANTSGGEVFTWTDKYVVIGPNAGSSQGSSLALGYNADSNRSEIVSLAPNIEWRDLYFYTSNIRFNTQAGGFSAVINASGDVGIGTMNPGAKLHISNGSSTAYLRITGRDRETYFGQDSIGCAVYSSNNVPMYFVTNDIERVRITGDGSFGITQTPGKYTIDTTGGQTTIAGSGTVDFPNCSGMLVVNNHSNGRVTIYLCGGGLTTVVASVVGQCGTFAYNAGIGGYTWTNDSSTAVFGFFFVRTRPTA
jgi:hypothetical protein